MSNDAYEPPPHGCMVFLGAAALLLALCLIAGVLLIRFG